ncbi:hypothetical protein HK097_011256, partial [Rhizophlyctis rosea]
MNVQYFPVDTKSQPTYLALKEWANEKNLDVLLKSASLDSELKKLLRKYKTLRNGPNVFQVEYCFSKHAYNESRRLYARNGYGFQMFPKWVRSFLSGEYYIDVDQRKSLPTILKGVFEEYEIENEILDDILAEKKSYEKKVWFKAILDGERPSDKDLWLLWDDIYNRLVPKLKGAHYFSDLWKHCKASKNKTKECRVLLAEKKAMEDEGFLVDSLQFDGFLVRKQPEVEVTETVLTQCAEKTKELAKYFVFLAADIASINPQDEDTRLMMGGNTHLEVAKMLHIKVKGFIVFDGKDFWAFTEQWKPVAVVHIKRELLIHVNSDVEKKLELDLNADDIKHLESLLDNLQTDRFVESTIKMLQTVVYDDTFLKRLDSDPMLLGAQNGYIDIRTGKLKPHSKDVLISKTIGYDYFTDEKPFIQEVYDEWKDAVKKFFPKRDERRWVQTFMGYCLRGDHPEKVFAIFKDKQGGYNGNTKFLQACMKAMGTYANKGQPNTILKSTGPRNQSGHNAHIFANEGFHLAAYEELPDEELDTKRMKDYDGGNSTESGRRVNGNFDEVVKCNCKTILEFNDKCQPKFDTSDTAWLERAKLFIFRSKFLQTQAEYDACTHEYKFLQDRNIDEKIKKWLPYILFWMMHGHVLYLQDGFTKIPQSCKDWMDGTARDVDNLQSWVEDNLEKSEDDDHYVTLKQIKDKMTKGMRDRFKNNNHMIKGLSPILGKVIADTEIDK